MCWQALPHLLAADLESNMVASINTFTGGFDNSDRLKPLEYLQFINLTERQAVDESRFRQTPRPRFPLP